jgi:hypothetical protein
VRADDAWQDHDLIFATSRGTPVNPNNLLRDFRRLVARAGVPRIRIHDLRHTHITLAIQAGAPIGAVSRRSGHARVSTTTEGDGRTVSRMSAGHRPPAVRERQPRSTPGQALSLQRRLFRCSLPACNLVPQFGRCGGRPTPGVSGPDRRYGAASGGRPIACCAKAHADQMV